MRQRVTLTLKNDTTVGVGGERGFLIRSHQYIPSSVLRGGLAARWIAEYGPPSQNNAHRDEFLKVFHGDIRFGPAFANGTSVEPLSAKVCKYKPNTGCRILAVDLAFEDDRDTCECEGPLEPGKGRMVPDIALTDRTRTAIDFESQTAKDGHLFRRQAISAGTNLRGFVRGNDPWLESVSGSSIWLGGKRTVAGKVLFAIEQTEPAFVPSDRVLTIRLTSPAVLVDDAALPVTRIDESVVASLLGVVPSAISSARGWTRTTWVGGWHIASGLPKPQDIALAAGSTIQVEMHEEMPQDSLKRLLHRGLGVRTEEGYGSFEFVTDAWRPPAPAYMPADTPVREEWPRLRAMSRDERKWIGNLLRDRWSASYGGGPLPAAGHRRLRSWSEEEREEFRRLSDLDDAKEMSRIITLLLYEGDDAQ